MRILALVPVAALTVFYACLDSKKSSDPETPAVPVTPGLVDIPDAANLTYHKDIKAIVVSKCTSCHTEGGLGGFSLETYPELTAKQGSVRSAVLGKRMPPWIADAGHQTYKDDLSLTPIELSKLVQWIDRGAQEGQASDYKAPQKKETFAADQTYSIFTDGGSYLPDQKRADDYRCFIVPFENKLDAVNYVTGFDAIAGNKKIVHHIVVYMASAEILPYLNELDQEEPGRGYECFGGATPDRIGDPAVQAAWEKKYPGSIRKLNDENYWLAHWAPGMEGGYSFPDQSGIMIPKGGAFVVQMHYYTNGAKDEVDQNSTVAIKTATQVRKPAFYYPLTKAGWTESRTNRSMVIPAGEERTFSTERSLSQIADYGKRVLKLTTPIKNLEAHSSNLHMHAFGKSGIIRQGRVGQDAETLLSVSAWDLHWQRDFQWETAKVVPLAELGQWRRSVECTYSNSTESEVFGGYGSYDEMCFDFGYFAFELAE